MQGGSAAKPPGPHQFRDAIFHGSGARGMMFMHDAELAELHLSALDTDNLSADITLVEADQDVLLRRCSWYENVAD
jgi:hypothetical protein